MSFYSAQSFMRIIVCLFDQGKFFTLALVQAGFYRVSFFEPFKAQYKKFCIIFIVQWWERYVLKFTGL